MKDTIIKGSGNSRSLKTVPNALTLYPTHEAMVAAMVDGTFPIDLGPLSAAGVQERGMDLNKANLLSDATAALYGLSGDDTSPDEVLAAISGLIAAAQNAADSAYAISGSYNGTNDSIKINLGFNPTFFAAGGLDNSSNPGFGIRIADTIYAVKKTGAGSSTGVYSYSSGYEPDGFPISGVLNVSGKTFYYVALK